MVLFWMRMLSTSLIIGSVNEDVTAPKENPTDSLEAENIEGQLPVTGGVSAIGIGIVVAGGQLNVHKCTSVTCPYCNNKGSGGQGSVVEKAIVDMMGEEENVATTIRV